MNVGDRLSCLKISLIWSAHETQNIMMRIFSSLVLFLSRSSSSTVVVSEFLFSRIRITWHIIIRSFPLSSLNSFSFTWSLISEDAKQFFLVLWFFYSHVYFCYHKNHFSLYIIFCAFKKLVFFFTFCTAEYFILYVFQLLCKLDWNQKRNNKNILEIFLFKINQQFFNLNFYFSIFVLCVSCVCMCVSSNIKFSSRYNKK